MKAIACLLCLWLIASSGTSLALVRFQDWTHDPIVVPGFGGDYDEAAVLDPELFWDGSVFRLYYTAVDGSGAPRIALALSEDARTWEPFGVVLDSGPADSFDEDGVSTPSILETDNGIALYYTGTRNGWSAIGRIDSVAGYVFDRESSPASLVLQPSWSEAAFDRIGVSDPTVVLHDGGYALMYQGHDGTHFPRLGYAVSSDGGWNFTRIPGAEGNNANFGRGPHGFDDGGALEPELFVVNGDVRLLYTSLHY